MVTQAPEANPAAEYARDIISQSFLKAGFTANKISKELSLIAFADMADFVQVDSEGSVKPLAFDELKKNKSRIIKKIKEKRRILNGKEDDTILEDTFEFELYSKLDAIKIAVDILGLNAPTKQEHQGSVTIEVITGVSRVPNED